MNKKTIDVEPTKKLFIQMLTRDILLSNAIIDLIDNSVDAALNNAKDPNYLHDFKINITINSDEFLLSDNCGGISLKDAMEYAFVFGRPKEVLHSVGNIGQFGIGMKRTIFKIGQICKIDTLSLKDSFSLEFDVAKWIDTDKWNLELTDIKEDLETELSNTYTKIHITNLYDPVSNEFKSTKFIGLLKQKIIDSHYLSIKKGLKIFINEVELELETELPKIKYTDEIGYFHKKTSFYSGINTVTVRVYAGIVTPRDINKAGWYIYCNNRLLLSANRDFMTGWNVNEFKKFHQDFAFFRGYVYFESINGELLPWTTTKDGINFGSEVYQKVLSIMQDGTDGILNFLSDYAKEKGYESKEENSTEKLLIDAMDKLEIDETVNTVDDTSKENVFKSPDLSIISRKVLKKYASVTYRRPKDELDSMKKHFLVDTYKDVGLETYSYYIENELD